MPRTALFLQALMLASLLGIAGCASTPETPKGPERTFGPWALQQCTLSSTAADLWLRTTGNLTYGGELEIRAHFTPLLVRPPFATLSGLPVPIRVEGSNRAYTFFVPYNPTTGAQMLQENAYLTVSYQPLGGTAIQDVSFATAPLMQGLGALGGCR